MLKQSRKRTADAERPKPETSLSGFTEARLEVHHIQFTTLDWSFPDFLSLKTRAYCILIVGCHPRSPSVVWDVDMLVASHVATHSKFNMEHFQAIISSIKTCLEFKFQVPCYMFRAQMRFFSPLPCDFPAGTYMTTGSLRKISTSQDFALLGHVWCVLCWLTYTHTHMYIYIHTYIYIYK